MSGAGKSTLLQELEGRGHVVVDTDYGGWTTPEGVWDESRMDKLLARHPDLVVSGTVENQTRFYDRFDQIVLITAPLEVLMERLRARANNPYGKTAAEQDDVARYVQSVEPLLRRGASMTLDGQRPVADLADDIERLLTES
jgi:dephospho-CoA kinase